MISVTLHSVESAGDDVAGLVYHDGTVRKLARSSALASLFDRFAHVFFVLHVLLPPAGERF
jgi:hypothetical protein